MFRFIEKSFLKITQILGLLFATIILVMAVIMSYNKVDVDWLILLKT
jgi:preprotein translocase subunit SecG